MRKKYGMTLIEVTVAMIIFGLTVSGLVNIFITGKKYIIHSRARMTSGELGRVFLEPLQAQVRQDNWDTAANDLRVGTWYCDDVPAHTQLQICPPTAADRTINNLPYTARYAIANDIPGTDLRRVRLTVSWTEPQP